MAVRRSEDRERQIATRVSSRPPGAGDGQRKLPESTSKCCRKTTVQDKRSKRERWATWARRTAHPGRRSEKYFSSPARSSPYEGAPGRRSSHLARQGNRQRNRTSTLHSS